MPPLCDLAQAEGESSDRPGILNATETSLALDAEPERHRTSSRPLLPHDTLESVLVPLDGLVAVDAVGSADAGLAAPALGDTLTGAGPDGMLVSAPTATLVVLKIRTCSSRSPCRRYRSQGRT